MSWLNHLKIAIKVNLIVALMAVVTVGTVIFATQRMRMGDDAYSDVVARVDQSTTLAVRARGMAENYVSSAFQLAAETTDEGNAMYLAQTDTSRKAYESIMAAVLKDLPEKRAIIDPTVANFQQAFAACDPGIKYAATTNTPEDNLKAAQRLKAECVPLAEQAIKAHVKMVDALIASSKKVSDNLTEEADFAIRMVWIAAGVGLFLGHGPHRGSVQDEWSRSRAHEGGATGGRETHCRTAQGGHDQNGRRLRRCRWRDR